eukprot:6211925-Pleurochrysis_carterae.AAC.3
MPPACGSGTEGRGTSIPAVCPPARALPCGEVEDQPACAACATRWRPRGRGRTRRAARRDSRTSQASRGRVRWGGRRRSRESPPARAR